MSNNFFLLFNMKMALRFIISSALTIALFYSAADNLLFENIPPVQIWWLIMLVGSLILFFTTFATKWRYFGLLTASFLIGISSQLGLTQPLWFQYIKIVPDSGFAFVLYITIAVQAALTFWVLLSRHLLPIIHQFIITLSYQRSLFFTLLLLAISIPVTRYIGDHNYFGLFSQAIVTGTFLLINITSLFALYHSLPEHALKSLTKRIEQFINFSDARKGLRTFGRFLPYIVALWVFIVSALICFFAFERMPRVPDEVAYLFQAKALLQGQLAVSFPAVPAAAFDYYLLPIRDNMWFSVCSPGWPSILALGVHFNLAWLVNPILAGISILLAHAFFKSMISRKSANIIILLLAISPWFLIMSASLMTHTSTLTLLLAAWVSLLNAHTKKHILLALFAGLLMGYLFLIRPLDGLIMGTLTGLWLLSQLKEGGRWKVILGYSAGCIAIGALIFPFNSFLSGDPLLTPINQYMNEFWYPGANRLGFGPDIGPPNRWKGIDLYHGHSILEALINLQQNCFTLSSHLFGWGIGSLSLFLVHTLWGKWTRIEFFMLTIIVVSVGTYSLYWFSASFYIGPRYWFMTLLPLTVITASGLNTLAFKIKASRNTTFSTQKFGLAFIVLGTVSISTYLTWSGVNKYYEFRGYHTDYRTILSKNDLKNSLVFVKTTSKSEFSSAFMYNSPFLSETETIFALDLGQKSNLAVANAFPDRSIYFIEGRSKRLSHARITLGPISRNALR